MEKNNFNKHIFKLDENLFLVNLIELKYNSIPRLTKDLEAFLFNIIKNKEYREDFECKFKISMLSSEEWWSLGITQQKLVMLKPLNSDLIKPLQDNECDEEISITIISCPYGDDDHLVSYLFSNNDLEDDYTVTLNLESILTTILKRGLGDNYKVLVIKVLSD